MAILKIVGDVTRKNPKSHDVKSIESGITMTNPWLHDVNLMVLKILHFSRQPISIYQKSFRKLIQIHN